MFRKFIVLSVIFGALMSCNNANQEEATAITAAEFEVLAEGLLDKTVSIEGTVMHVCKHGGKKMFLNEERIKVIASEKIASFNTEWEGSDIIVKGIIRNEAQPVLADDATDTKHTEAVPAEDGEQVAQADCDFETVKPIWVIEVIEVTEKVQ